VANDLGDDIAKIKNVSVSTVTDTNVMRISASSESPEVAKAAANSYAHNYTDQRQARLVTSVQGTIDSTQKQIEDTKGEITTLTATILANPNGAEVEKLLRSQYLTQQATLQKQLQEAQTQKDTLGKAVTVTREAGNPRLPDSPNPLRDAGVAAMVALVFGIGLAFLLEQLDNRVKSYETVDLATDGVPVLGTVPAYGGNKHTRRFRSAPRALVAASSPASESYHTLATSLRFSSIGKEKRTILVTSSSGGEGKTTVTANLAAVLAESGLRVVVVSADLRRPMLGELLGVPDNQNGLTSAMLGDADLSSCFVSVTLPSGKSLFVLPASAAPRAVGPARVRHVRHGPRPDQAGRRRLHPHRLRPGAAGERSARRVAPRRRRDRAVAARQDQDRQPAPDGHPAAPGRCRHHRRRAQRRARLRWLRGLLRHLRLPPLAG